MRRSVKLTLLSLCAGVVVIAVAAIYIAKHSHKGGTEVSNAVRPAETAEKKVTESTAAELAVSEKKPTAPEIEATTEALPEPVPTAEMNMKAAKALLLADCPPPNDGVQIADTDGPASLSPHYTYKKGDTYRVHAYTIMTRPGTAGDMPDWIDQGELNVTVKEVNAETQAATEVVSQLTAAKGVIGPVKVQDALKGMKIQDVERTVYPDGRVELPDTMTVNGAVPIKMDMGAAASAGILRFPEGGKELAVGEKWEIQSGSTDYPAKGEFVFEGYSLVNGVKCMRIRETSTMKNRMEISAANHKVALSMATQTEGCHYFDIERGLEFRADLDQKMQMNSDDPNMNKALKDMEARTVKQVLAP